MSLNDCACDVRSDQPLEQFPLWEHPRRTFYGFDDLQDVPISHKTTATPRYNSRHRLQSARLRDTVSPESVKSRAHKSILPRPPLHQHNHGRRPGKISPSRPRLSTSKGSAAKSCHISHRAREHIDIMAQSKRGAKDGREAYNAGQEEHRGEQTVCYGETLCTC